MSTALLAEPLPFEFHEDLAGRRFMFVGPFERWPFILGGAEPGEHVRARGAQVVEDVEQAHYLILGEKRVKGRAEALRKAEKLRTKGVGPTVLDQRSFLHIVRPKLEGRSFLFAGGFSHDLDLDGPAALVTALGGRLAGPEDDDVDFCVIGQGRAKGKAAVLRRVERLHARGSKVRVLDEEQFLQLLACARGPDDSGFDVRALAVELRSLTDAKKVDRAIQMLKHESFHLYAEAAEGSIGGIVKSQTQPEAFYSCWIQEDGRYGCFDKMLGPCWGQSGEMCKHLLVLVVGLCATHEVPPRRAYRWARAASRRRPSAESGRSAELILRYRGAQAGEVDWRPTETVPEDYYAL